MKVLIIGAGIAGLVAANELAREGIRPLVIEARDRIGGRILTLRENGSDQPIELGAEFVHGTPREIFSAANRAGIKIVETAGEFWYLTAASELKPTDDGPPGNEGSVWDKIENYVKHSDKDLSFEDFLSGPVSIDIPAGEREWLRRYVGGFHAAELHKVGVKSLIKTTKAEESIEGDRSFRIPSGYKNLAQYFYNSAVNAGASFIFGNPVESVNWRAGGVETILQNGTERHLGEKAIITLPVGVLKAGPADPGFVLFDPDIAVKQSSLARIEMGAARRVVLHFHNKWWNDDLAEIDKRKVPLGFLFGQDLPLPVWWADEPSDTALLTGWAGGQKALELARSSDDEVIERALNSLASIFSAPVSELWTKLISANTYDWQTDPFARGAYSYLGVNGVDTPQELSIPIDNTLYFAGEATNSDGHWGTVHGAISTGTRAAREILASS